MFVLPFMKQYIWWPRMETVTTDETATLILNSLIKCPVPLLLACVDTSALTFFGIVHLKCFLSWPLSSQCFFPSVCLRASFNKICWLFWPCNDTDTGRQKMRRERDGGSRMRNVRGGVREGRLGHMKMRQATARTQDALISLFKEIRRWKPHTDLV